jgi:hypothetical protein
VSQVGRGEIEAAFSVEKGDETYWLAVVTSKFSEFSRFGRIILAPIGAYENKCTI